MKKKINSFLVCFIFPFPIFKTVSYIEKFGNITIHNALNLSRRETQIVHSREEVEDQDITQATRSPPPCQESSAADPAG